jgi:hypothetical protein
MDYEGNLWPENMPLLYLAAQLARLSDLISYDELLNALMIFTLSSILELVSFIILLEL